MIDGVSKREQTVAAGVYFLIYAAVGLITMLPLVFSDRGLTNSQIGYLAAMFAAAGALTQVGIGSLSDRLQRRKMFVIIPMLLLAVCFGSLLRVYELALIAGLYVICGISFHASNTALTAYIADWSSAAGRAASSFASARLWGSVGFVFSLVALSRWLESDSLVILGIAVFFVLSAVVMSFGRESERHTEAAVAKTSGASLLLKNPNLTVFLICYLLYRMAESGSMAYFALRMADIGGTRQIVAWALVVNAIFEIPLMRWAGPLSERIGRRPVLLTAMLTLPLRTAAYALIPTAYWVFPVQVFHGFTYAFMTVGAMAYVNDHAPNHLRATAQGLLGMTTAAAMCLGPLMAGVISGFLPLSTLYLILAATAGLGAVGFVLFVHESYGPAVERWRNSDRPVPLWYRPLISLNNTVVISDESDNRR